MEVYEALTWTAVILLVTGFIMFATVSSDMSANKLWRGVGITGIAFIAIAIALLIASVWVQV